MRTITGGGASSKSLVKKVLLGEVYQFPILEHIGDFLLDKKIKVRHPVFLRAVCKKTDEMIRSDDTVWKRLLKHRLSDGTNAEEKKLRPEAKRITGAYERWLVHTAHYKSVHEKKVYWPSIQKKLLFHKLKRDIGFFWVELSYIRERESLLGNNPNQLMFRIHSKIKRRNKKIQDLVSGGHRHFKNRSLSCMVESGKVLQGSILPLVQGLVEASKIPRKPPVPKTKAMIVADLFKQLPKFVI